MLEASNLQDGKTCRHLSTSSNLILPLLLLDLSKKSACYGKAFLQTCGTSWLSAMPAAWAVRGHWYTAVAIVSSLGGISELARLLGCLEVIWYIVLSKFRAALTFFLDKKQSFLLPGTKTTQPPSEWRQQQQQWLSCKLGLPPPLCHVAFYQLLQVCLCHGLALRLRWHMQLV